MNTTNIVKIENLFILNLLKRKIIKIIKNQIVKKRNILGKEQEKGKFFKKFVVWRFLNTGGFLFPD